MLLKQGCQETYNIFTSRVTCEYQESSICMIKGNQNQKTFPQEKLQMRTKELGRNKYTEGRTNNMNYKPAIQTAVTVSLCFSDHQQQQMMGSFL